MRKFVLMAAVILGLGLWTAPSSEACSTHGYVRASTLNDLFNGTNGVGGDSIKFDVDNIGSGGDHELGDLFNAAGFNDDHKYKYKIGNGEWVTQGTGGDAAGELNGIIAAIEQSLSQQYDQTFAD